MYKQIIIVRKDLNMSPGKLSAQVSHASMAFLTNLIRNSDYTTAVTHKELIDGNNSNSCENDDKVIGYYFKYIFDKELYEQWIDGEFTKCVLQAKNRNQLLKAKKMAEELGMREGYDFFCIKDNCHTELDPEEVDEDCVGRTLTCIGFRPMKSEIINQISKRFHLYV